MKRFGLIFLYGISVVVTLILTLFIYFLIGLLQEQLFVPNDYMMWVFKYPASRFVLIYEVILLLGLFLVINKKWNKNEEEEWYFWKKHKKVLLPSFIVGNVILFYFIVTSVTVITGNKIVDHSFLSPQGKEYTYADVVKVEAGVYGKKLYFPFSHSKGDFFYRLELVDGTEIDLAEVGGVIGDEHEFFILEELDQKLAALNVPKTSSMENFEILADYYDPIYSEKVSNILSE